MAVAAVALVLIAGRRLGALIPAFTTWVDGLGVWGPVAFVAGYALATVAFVPGSLLTLAAGAIFGLGKGTALVLVAATLGASAAFLVARYRRARIRRAPPGRERALRRHRPRHRERGAEDRVAAAALARLPVQPAQLRPRPDPGALRATTSVASIGMLPGTLLYVYYGKVAGDVARLAGGAAVPRGAAYYARGRRWDWSPRWSSRRSSPALARRALQRGDRWRHAPADAGA